MSDLIKILREDENYTGDTEQAEALVKKILAAQPPAPAAPQPVIEGRTLTWGDKTYVEASAPKEQPSLKAYKVDEGVQVLRQGDWVPGQISSIDKISHHLHVQTERGPVTVASSNNVRKAV